MKKYILITASIFALSCEIPEYDLDNSVDEYLQSLNTPALFFNPTKAEVNLNDTAYVQIYALEVDSVAGMHLQINYDWGSVELDTVLADDFFIESDYTLLFYEDTDGTLDIHLFFLPNEKNSVNGTIALCVLVFKTRSLGESQLKFSSDTKVVNPRNESIRIRDYGLGKIDVK